MPGTSGDANNADHINCYLKEIHNFPKSIIFEICCASDSLKFKKISSFINTRFSGYLRFVVKLILQIRNLTFCSCYVFMIKS